eukprot:Ihof_evm1s508 gene=Ihof_evmTU1s508
MDDRPAIQRATLAQRMLIPVVSVVASSEAKDVLAKNNLSFPDLLRPFGRVSMNYTLRDSYQQSYSLNELYFRFAELEELEKISSKEIVAELSRVLTDQIPPPIEEMVKVRNRSDIPAYLQQDTPLPWFDAYVSTLFSLMRGSHHDTFNHPVAVLCVVSSDTPDPIGALTRMFDPKHPPAPFNKPHVDPNVVTCHVLVHDLSHGPSEGAQLLFADMQHTFEASTCFYLEINSRTASTPPTDCCPKGVFPDIIYPPITSMGMRRASTQSLLLSRVSSFPSPLSPLPDHARTSQPLQSSSQVSIDDLGSLSPTIPYANPFPTKITGLDGIDGTPPSRPSPSLGATSLPLTQRIVTGSMLTVDDLARITAFVKELAVRAIVPFMAKRMYLMSEQLAHLRKGMARTLLSSTKKWFGGSTTSQKGDKPMVSSGYNPTFGYKWEGIEAQMRRLGDLAFMLRDYDLANQTYASIKRDYQQDRAWMHIAGTQEMIGICMHMLDPTRRDCDPIIDQAISSYNQRGAAPLWAERSGLLLADIQCARGQWREAAGTYIRMTGEDSDMRSGLLLEKAGHMFLRLASAMFRKYSFHLILSGHRYTKCGQRTHALHCYNMALQVYQSNNWSLAEDHIYFTLGRQSYYLNNICEAQQAFAKLLRSEKQPNSQEAAYLREFLNTMRQYLVEQEKIGAGDVPLPELPVPNIDMDTIQVRLFNVLKTNLPEENWTFMEKTLSESLMEKVRLPHLLKFTPSRPVLNNSTDNTVAPTCPLGETVVVEFTMYNSLQTPLQVTDVSLICTFTPSSERNEKSEEPPYSVSLVEKININAKEKYTVSLSVTPQKIGKLVISGVEYTIGGLVRGRKDFVLKGRRLNKTKHDRLGVYYSPDLRLHISVVAAMPLLELSYSSLPESVYAGEVSTTELRLSNVGLSPLRNLCAIASDPINLCFGMDKAVIVDSMGNEIRRFPQNAPLLDRVVYSNYSMNNNNSNNSNSNSNDGIFVLLRGGEQLQAGETMVVPLHFRTDVLGPQQLNVLFAYRSTITNTPPVPASKLSSNSATTNTTNSKANFKVMRRLSMTVKQEVRYTRMRLDTTAQSSLRVGTFVQPSRTRMGDVLLGVELENLHGQTRFHLQQITCISDRWAIESLSFPLGLDYSHEHVIGPREVMSTYFSVKRRPENEKKSLIDTRVNNPHRSGSTSDVVFAGNKAIRCSECPVTNFYLKDEMLSREAGTGAYFDSNGESVPSSPRSSRGSMPGSPIVSRAPSRMNLALYGFSQNLSSNSISEEANEILLQAEQDDYLSLIILWTVPPININGAATLPPQDL